MSFSLRIANGDLVASGSNLGIVYGVNKLVQDLTLWMAERYAIDRFHTWYGSQFENYIGGIIVQGTNTIIYNEAMRVLDNYQKVQSAGFKQSPTLYSLDELLYSINSVNVGITYDQVSVAVNVSNAQGQSTTVTTSSTTS